MSTDWTNIEIDLILSDYFDMLRMELSGEKYSKAEHYRGLIPLLNNRSKGSIERKHQNISAVLKNLNHPFIRGYQPLSHYQRSLVHPIIEHLDQHKELDILFGQFSEKSVELEIIISGIDFNKILENPPQTEPRIQQDSAKVNRQGRRTNYLLKEQNNSKLGHAGEQFALEFEKWQLIRSGKDNLADQVEWVSQTKGDGLGFDILSRNTNGTDKYIEVKTTKLSKEAPFFFTKNEMQFSVERARDFHLYRVFQFDSTPRLFTLNGSLDKVCRSEAEVYRGFF
jgi:hypothetical protein